MKILVIEDDRAVQKYICKILTADGYEVICADDGLEGMQKISIHLDIAIVVTDLIMPGKEGIETIMEIKKLRPSVKILAISGGGRMPPGLYLRCAEALGADASLQKPFAPTDFLDVISDFSSGVAAG